MSDYDEPRQTVQGLISKFEALAADLEHASDDELAEAADYLQRLNTLLQVWLKEPRGKEAQRLLLSKLRRELRLR